MAAFQLCVSTCSLLLLLQLTLGPGPTEAMPVSTDRCADCSLLFRGLLLNVTDLLDSNVLCFGIISDKVALGSEAETLLTCTPALTQSSGCVMRRNSSFSESECLRNIMKDLLFYEAAIESYLRSELRSPTEEEALLRPTLVIIQSLKNCSQMSGVDTSSLQISEDDAAQTWAGDTYTNRQEMCKMMRGFYVRAITINRAMGYISSGDHRK